MDSCVGNSQMLRSTKYPGPLPDRRANAGVSSATKSHHDEGSRFDSLDDQERRGKDDHQKHSAARVSRSASLSSRFYVHQKFCKCRAIDRSLWTQKEILGKLFSISVTFNKFLIFPNRNHATSMASFSISSTTILRIDHSISTSTFQSCEMLNLKTKAV